MHIDKLPDRKHKTTGSSVVVILQSGFLNLFRLLNRVLFNIENVFPLYFFTRATRALETEEVMANVEKYLAK